MSRILVLAVVFCLGAGGLSAGEKAKPSPRWAPTWEDAVETAQALNAPIIVHRHGFY